MEKLRMRINAALQRAGMRATEKQKDRLAQMASAFILTTGKAELERDYFDKLVDPTSKLETGIKALPKLKSMFKDMEGETEKPTGPPSPQQGGGPTTEDAKLELKKRGYKVTPGAIRQIMQDPSEWWPPK